MIGKQLNFSLVHIARIDILLKFYIVEVYAYLYHPSLDQEVIDSLSFELLKAVLKLASVSERCLEIAKSVINQSIIMCSPRDMLSILCEALAKIVRISAYYTHILRGFLKVMRSIRRHCYE